MIKGMRFLVVLLGSLLMLAITVPVLASVNSSYPGTIQLDVDATSLDVKIFQIRELIPVTAGKMTLLYPQWLPGKHSPAGALTQLAGLTLTANGQAIEWQRDQLNMYAFHLTVPAGVTQLEAHYQFLSPVETNQGRIVVTPEIIGVQWNAMVLYPGGYAAGDIHYQANLRFPSGWKIATALELASQQDDQVHFKPVRLDDLVDSPLYAGKYLQRFELAPTVVLNVVADRPESLDTTAEQIKLHRNLIEQAYKLYGAPHYQHYDFLLALSEQFSSIGLEHLQSSENGVKSGYFSDWSKNWAERGLLPHEFTHSWNGKYRRPADLSTSNFDVPMQDSLLWVYEGQTQYWGEVLAVRSGLISVEQYRDSLANVAASYDLHVGRSWRALQDTTHMPTIAKRGPLAWSSWQRGEDYYREGQLIWLDVDSKLRELSGEKKSLNDFAHAFFGKQSDLHAPLTYTFDDVVEALQLLAPYDWGTFFRTRLDGHAAESPKDGIHRAGWQLLYTEERNDATKSEEEQRHYSDFSYSLGVQIGKEGRLENVIWDSLAFQQGLTVGAVVVAVNGRSYSAELLRQAISAAKSTTQTIELLIKKDDRYRSVSLDYHAGLKYPHLVRMDSTPDRLKSILAPM